MEILDSDKVFGSFLNTETDLVIEGKVLDKGLARNDQEELTDIYIKDCEIKSSIHFDHLYNLERVSFENCTFSEGAHISIWECKCEWLRLENCTCLNESRKVGFLFHDSEFTYVYINSFLVKQNTMRFWDVTTKECFSLSNSYSEKISFVNCVFDGEYKMSSPSYTDHYIEELEFKNCTFSSSSRIERCHMNSLSLNTCVVQTGASFMLAEYCKINTLKLSSMSIHGIAVLSPGDYHKATIADSLISGGLTLSVDSIRGKLDTYTANLLKNEAVKRNDFLSARKLHKIEMDAHMRYLLGNLRHFTKHFRFKKRHVSILRRFSSQYFIHVFNKISNNHGTSWGRGVCFTLLITLIFTLLIYLTLFLDGLIVLDFTETGFAFFANGYLDVLNIIKYSDIINDIELSWIGRALHLLSRIFIAYGVYQVVSAFRSYGKKV